MLFLLCVALFAAGAALELEVDITCPTCVIVNNTCYNASFVLDLNATFRNRIVIHKIGLLRSDNMLLYSFEPEIKDPEYYKTGFVNLDNETSSGVFSSQKLIVNFGTFDIDQANSMIYLGGSDGIFVLDTTEKKLSPFSSRGDTIMSLFFKNNVYFSKENEKGITVKKGDNFRTLLENVEVKNFVINKYDVIVFLTKAGLFVGKGDVAYRISQNPFFRGLVIDLEELVYAWWVDGIYRVVIEKNLEDSRIVKVANLMSIGAMTFDNNNNILFTLDKSLFKMAPTEIGCKVKTTKKYSYNLTVV